MAVTSDYTEKHLADTLAKYTSEAAMTAPGENIELEVRFKDITQGVFESIYSALNSDAAYGEPTLECSVNVISTDLITASDRDASYIRKLIFTGPTLASEVYQKKTRLMRPVYINGYIKYAIGLAREAIVPKFDSSSNATVRFKVRVSFEHAGKWRYDLTAVRSGSLSGLKSTLKTIKHDLFTERLSARDLLNSLNFKCIDALEVEIEYIGGKIAPAASDIMAITGSIFAMINPHYLVESVYQDEIYKVAEYIITNHDHLREFKKPAYGLKQLSNQVMALSKNTYYLDVYPPEGMYLTIKADGQRAIVSVDGNRCRIIRANDILEYIAGDAYISGETTIADVELVPDKEEKSSLGDDTDSQPKGLIALVFDVMVYRNENISKNDFSLRVEYITDAATLIAGILEKSKKQVDVPHCTATPKHYLRLREGALEAGFREIWEGKYPFTCDGLIITTPLGNYTTTKNYKWKPLDRNTIDFLAVKAPQKMLGIAPYETRKGMTLYLLFVGIDHKMREALGIGLLPQYGSLFPASQIDNKKYYPIQFSPSADPLAYIYYHDANDNIDGKIIELSRSNDESGTPNTWVFHHVRADRKASNTYYGNDFRIAELTYINHIDVFPLEALWTPSDSYFTKTADGMYAAPNRYKRFVISILLAAHVRNAKFIIDLASGRGADLHRYQELGVENALFIDVDATAIAELIRRKYSFFGDKRRKDRAVRGGSVSDPVATNGDTARDRATHISGLINRNVLTIKDIKALTVHTLVADLRDPHARLIASTFQFGINEGMIDAIVCNFALHYMCDTVEHLRNILLFTAKMLRVGGVFIFTVMDGESVFNALRKVPTGKCMVSREGTVLKYAIRKDYSGDKLSDVGQMISVMLPFSDKLYSEPLCNVKFVISEASQLGFKSETSDLMGVHLSSFERADKALYGRLTADDRINIDLHRGVVLRLVKKAK